MDSASDLNEAPAHDFTLHRDAFGKLVFTAANGDLHRGVIPVRAFPIGAPDDGIALVGHHGEELAWIERLPDLPAPVRELVTAELASREFMPEIKRIVQVSTFATPSDWSVETSCGDTVFTLKGEEDIRRILRSGLLIADIHGVHFLVRDMQALDKASRKILDRFL
ncbi:DUF1854 domain-containing protein [Oxalobacteraceae bacterium CAVE-383]|nr:DUF1854 domain-containing protein [Oxalobacteraceae bacterium CAVE-383]